MTSRVCFDHYINPAYKRGAQPIWLFKQTHEGYKFPDEKEEVLSIVEKGLQIDESHYVVAEELTEGFI